MIIRVIYVYVIFIIFGIVTIKIFRLRIKDFIIINADKYFD